MMTILQKAKDRRKNPAVSHGGERFARRLLVAVLLISLLVLSVSIATAATEPQFRLRMNNTITQADKEAAAAAFKHYREDFLLHGLKTTQAPSGVLTGGGTAGAIGIEQLPQNRPILDPGGLPHYFGPYPNWANSPMPKGGIAGITVDAGGTGYSATPIITIADVYFTGSGAEASASVTGGVITGITIVNAGTNYTAPVVIIEDTTGTGAAATASIGGPFHSGIRKFVDTLPGLNAANNLGQYIPIAIADTATFPGSDYYEIELGEFTEKMHSDLPNTTIRGYRQVNTADPIANKFHYLGPQIIAQEGRPVRVKFINSLPIGTGGNLFIPVDTTVMGAGMGPLEMNTSPNYYTQNRAELHLHGGNTPWISDGTPHQWITPANEYTDYPKGVTVYNVPDMPDPGPGAMTFFYSNQQSARLMFYHDHAFGITRLNVYAGEAAGYLLTDQVETDLIAGTNVMGVNPGTPPPVVLPGLGIPLIIQDKTFVDADTIAAQDPTWEWGTTPWAPKTGDLWFPHVYMTVQNPYALDGVNPYGRWPYGPWFWPPTQTAFGPVANPYYDPVNAPWEPPQNPGVPHPSFAMEAFQDTMLVNGAVYPNVTLNPQSYRFRILNAANDRFLNLQLYVADATVTTADGRTNTEVKMVPAVFNATYPADWPADGRVEGVPDPATIGPSFIMIGTEGGFLPAPVVIPNQPITWVTDPTVFNAGNVDKHALVLGPAERADVIVDFSQYAGKTLILYNDAPAPFPARAPQYDYFTGAPDLTSTGGAWGVQPGYGPNTRTIMQIKVANAVPAPAYNLGLLNSVFANVTSGPGAKRGVFEVSQPKVIVPVAGYNSAYGRTDLPTDNYVRIADTFKNLTTIDNTVVNITFNQKAIQDEQGEAFDEFGRLSGFLGLQAKTGPGRMTLLLYGYESPPTDILMESFGNMSGPVAGDGTQIWKITHNGVDTHPVHFHLFNVQVINRVGWDGIIRAPDPNELGWKETVRISPLEDTIVAMRPVIPTLPFDLPNSMRPLHPAMPLGVVLPSSPGRLNQWADPAAQPVTIINKIINFGAEYVFHCHILAHEEMDMMHSEDIALAVGPAPSGLVSGEIVDGATNTTSVYLAWTDNSIRESHWLVQRQNATTGNWSDVVRVPSYTGPLTGGTAMAIDSTIPANVNATYPYRVLASNVVGDDTVYPAPAVGFPTLALNSTPSAPNTPQTVAAPTASFTAGPVSGTVPLNVTFTDTSGGTPTGWWWDFGDGNYARDNGRQSLNHTYTIPGTYTVSLTAMTTGGNSTTTQVNLITVSPQPALPQPTTNFVADKYDGSAPLTVQFNADNSTSIPAVWAVWRWSFGDGTYSHLKNPIHTYRTGGVYDVSLTASNLGGTNTTTMKSRINVSWSVPFADFVAQPLTGRAPITVQFTDRSLNNPTTWNWTFGDGDLTNSTVQNPVHQYRFGGTFNVSLNVSNNAGFDVRTKTNYLNIASFVLQPPVITAVTPATGYRNQTVSFAIIGNNFQPNFTTVEFRNQSTGLLRATLTSVTLTRINGTIAIPMNTTTGFWYVRVITISGGENVRPTAYTIVNQPPPLLTAISPISGNRNTSISYSITGVNFRPDFTTVVFKNATGFVLNSTNLTAVTPTRINGTIVIPRTAWVGAYNVNITTVDGGSTPGLSRFAVSSFPAPTLTSITPLSGSQNTSVSYSIVGTNYQPGLTTVVFKNATGSVLNTTMLTSVTPTQIDGKIILPPNAWIGSYNVNISTVDGGSTPGTNRFAVTRFPAPTLTSITPATGSQNTTASYTIVGTNFQTGDMTTVVFRNASGAVLNPAVLTSVTPTRITGFIIIPRNAWIGAYNVNISTADGGSTPGTNRFAVTRYPAPTLTTITPASGFRNTSVSYSIVGTNFQPGMTTVVFKNASGVILNPTTLTSVTQTRINGSIDIPPSIWTGAYNVNISTVDGGSTPGLSRFTVNRFPAPTVTSFTPAIGWRDTIVSYTIVGTNYQPGMTVVRLTRTGSADIPTNVSRADPRLITGSAVIPPGTTTGFWNVNVTTVDGGAVTRLNMITIL